MGAIVAPVQLERIRGLVKQGVDEGATMWQPSWACPTEGYFYPPTLFTDVQPSSTIAQVEIFGPVLVTMTFRTPEESVALANNTPYGLAASVWTENINLALDIAPKIKAGVVWVNSTNLFDAAAGFGGYRESGFGREGGREGMWEYLSATPVTGSRCAAGRGDARSQHSLAAVARQTARPASPAAPAIDRTPKLFIGGKQARPDSGYSRRISAPNGELVGEVAGRESQGHPQRGGGRARGLSRAGARQRATIARRSSITSPRISRRAPTEFASRIACDDRRDGARRAARSRRVDLAAVHVRRVGRQVRRRGAPRADPRRRDRDERADRRDRHRVP